MNRISEACQPCIILAEPQLGENIGMAARAMLNCGLTRMRLVSPREGWPNAKAVSASSGAAEVIDNVQVFDTLHEAIADMQFVLATTARQRDMIKPVMEPRQAAKEIRKREAAGQNCAILFGSERTGLWNDDIARAHAIMTIPTNPEFSSLNLAQTVLLAAYEYRMQSQELEPEFSASPGPAGHAHLQDFMNRLEHALEDARFFRSPEIKPHMQRNLWALFSRAEPTEQELRTLHGVLSALEGKKIPAGQSSGRGGSP